MAQLLPQFHRIMQVFLQYPRNHRRAIPYHHFVCSPFSQKLSKLELYFIYLNHCWKLQAHQSISTYISGMSGTSSNLPSPPVPLLPLNSFQAAPKNSLHLLVLKIWLSVDDTASHAFFLNRSSFLFCFALHFPPKFSPYLKAKRSTPPRQVVFISIASSRPSSPTQPTLNLPPPNKLQACSLIH